MRLLVTLSLLLACAIVIQKTSRPPHRFGARARSGLLGHTHGTVGDEWLDWSPLRRIEYIEAYRDGYELGDQTGCLDTVTFYAANDGQTALPLPSEPMQNCRKVAAQWNESNESLAETISEYYTSFPTDYIVPVPLVMDSLSDQNHMTYLQIHHRYVEGELK
jgi:hypothetical protein